MRLGEIDLALSLIAPVDAPAEKFLCAIQAQVHVSLPVEFQLHSYIRRN